MTVYYRAKLKFMEVNLTSKVFHQVDEILNRDKKLQIF